MVNTRLLLTTAVAYNKTAYYVCEYEGYFPPINDSILTWYSSDSLYTVFIYLSITNSMIYKSQYQAEITNMPWPSDQPRPMSANRIYLIKNNTQTTFVSVISNPRTYPYGNYVSTSTETLTIKVVPPDGQIQINLNYEINLKFDYDINFNITSWYWVNGNELNNLYKLTYTNYMGTYKNCVFTQYLFYAGDPSTAETRELMKNIFGLYNNNPVIYAEFNDLKEGGYNKYGLINSSTPPQDELFVIEQITSQCFCFSQGTKILCLTQYLKEEYRLVQDLIIGDFVKSYLHGYRKVSKILTGSFVNNPNDQGVSNCMYKMIKNDDNELIEDLTLTRNHGVLVEKLTENEEKNVDKNNLPVIDNLLSIITADSDKFEKVMDTNWYKYYHFSLETDGDEDRRFGVWANGILVEVPSNNMMDGALNIKPLDF